MRRARVVALVLAGLSLAVLLLDWTVGALDPFRISRFADARALRAAMRSLDDGRALAHLPDIDVPLRGGRGRITTGPLGERVGSASVATADRALRILVVGGAAALGFGVDDALTFARRLERERAADGRPVHVTNAAHLFADAVEPGALAEHWLPRARPDVVLICGPAASDVPGAVLRGIGAGAGRDRSWIGELLPALWELDRFLGGELPHDAEGAPPRVDSAKRRTALGAAVSACRDAGARPVVVDLGGDPDLRDACAALGVERVDAAFTPADRRSPVFLEPEHGWPNAFGHERIRVRVARGLADLAILAPPAGR